MVEKRSEMSSQVIEIVDSVDELCEFFSEMWIDCMEIDEEETEGDCVNMEID
jgi:hypothetical protein